MTYLSHIALLKNALYVVTVRAIDLAEVFGQRNLNGGWHDCIIAPITCCTISMDKLISMMPRFLSIAALLATSVTWAQDQAATFQHTVQPFLATHCAACHNDKQKTASLSFDAFRDPAHALKQTTVWENVLDRLNAGTMPPPGPARPPRADVAAVTKWIESLVNPTGAPRDGNPGRVTARRLNRTEYNNTIRDLLGISIQPANEFPVDDSGYGFDNIGDVLTVSPMLMEKYMAAAAKVSRLAVFGEALPPKPTRLARLLNRRSPEATDVLSKDNYFPYSMRGSMYGNWVFPADAEYEFRLRVANFRPDVVPDKRARMQNSSAEELHAQDEINRKAAPPRDVVLTVDGRPVLTGVVEGTAAYGYHRGEFIARVPVKAGQRMLRASFPELADLEDPRKNINKDMRRQLFVDYLEIVGPFAPSTEASESYRRVFICNHARGGHQASCARPIIENLTRRAYRRPVTPREVDSKLALVNMALKDGDSLEEGIRLALEAVLASPNFLFHTGQQPAGKAASFQINEYDLASRLSYFLWGSMPDEELFQKAGSLRQPGMLNSQVRRMLADPKATNLVDNFAAQWLQLRILGRTKPDLARFPTVDDELLDSMRRETNLFVEAMIRENRSVLDFIDAPFTFLNGPLARHYGIAGVNGEQFRRVNLDGEQRSGLLTQASILTVSSYPTRTSPPVRGKWVLENLLGSAPPPPPADVPVLDESKKATTMSMRERLEQHRKDPSCAPCHNAMDPIGFGLERYDAVGSYRTHEGSVAIDSSGTLPDGKSFGGAKELKAILKSQSDAFTRNLTEKLLTFALGRGLERYDRAAVDQICKQAAQDGYKFSSIVLSIVNSKPFQMQSSEPGN